MRPNTLFLVILLLVLGAGLAPTNSRGDTTEPYPLEYFALRSAVSNVSVSPDGQHVSMLKIVSKDGDPVLFIYDADDLEKDPFIVNSDPMEILSYYWASDEHIVMTLRQRVRDIVKRTGDQIFAYRLAILNLTSKSFDDFDAAFPTVENVLPGKPGKIIVSEQPGFEGDLSLEKAFRPRAYYEMDLDKGTKKLILRGKISLGQVGFDSDGNPRFGRGYDASKKEYVLYYRDVGEKDWRDIYRTKIDNFELWFEEELGFDESIPGNILMKAFNGDDKLGLWSYNPKTKNFDELIYRRSDVDVYGVRRHSNSWTNPDRIVGVSYFKDKYHVEYFDEIEGATYKQLEGLIPHSHYVNIASRSRDGDSLIVYNSGPNDPGTYYLLHNGELKTVGSRNPLVDPESLAELKYFQFEARDGRKIAAFATIPKGEPPFPTVVMPHGGPHVLEIVLYDEWAQMLANNGYMVVQPQYRMSLGYGLDHFLSAFIDGSEAGRAMQDDKDDAALHLVKEGLADPDRIAMYGWSYGGYAALVTASRDPQIYQCTIAGAAVADYAWEANAEMRRTPDGVRRIWRDVYEYGAVQPIDEVEKVNIPVLVIHGDVDSTVLPRQARTYVNALEKAGKHHKYIEIEGLDHNPTYYTQQITIYESIIDFLANDCGNLSQLQAANDDD